MIRGEHVPMELQPGQVFGGRFRIVRRLGGGSFGEVHEAQELRDGSPLALKVLHPALISHPTLRERFEQEARITSLFKNPHVVALADAGVDSATGRPWVAFELLYGETLAARMEREPSMDRAGIEMLFAQLGAAIGAAHQAGVVHNDLKPENLFLTGPRDRPTLKVLDFGISRLVKAGRTSTKVTTEMGTPAWTAPEQFVRGAGLRPSTDVWPIGMLAFALFTGRHYLRSVDADGDTMNAIYEICMGELPGATARAREMGVDAKLPEGFDAWFRHCVVREPERRFQHARAAVNALLSVLRPAKRVAPTVEFAEPPSIPLEVRDATIVRSYPIASAADALTRGDYDTVRSALIEAVAGDDAPAEVWALRARCDTALGRYDDAVDAWSLAIERAPAMAAYIFERGLVFEAQGRAALARADNVLAAALGHELARRRLRTRV